MDSIVIIFIAGLIGLFAGMRKQPVLSLLVAVLGLIGAGLAAYFRGSYTTPFQTYAAQVPTPPMVIILLCGVLLVALKTTQNC